METWEQEHIRRNLQALVKLTLCHVQFLAILESRGALSAEDVQQIMAKDTDSEKAALLYRILPLRKNAYEILTGALVESKQSGASSILEKTPFEAIAKLRIQFLGKVCQVKELLTSEEIKQVHKCVQKNASPEECEEIEGKVLKSGNPVQLIRDTIPAPDPLYIPRFLCQRLDINPKLFKTECLDVFIFKNVERLELRTFIGHFKIESSEEILKRKQTDCRFILLRCDNHWDKLCSRITSPRHLIRFESVEETFVLEASTGDSNVLSHYLQRKNCQNISEAELVRKTVEEDIRSVCICDLPGMGKSLLLASLARQVAEENREIAIVAFIQLRHLDIQQHSDSDTILEYITSSVLAKFLLAALIKTRPANWFLFFDGLDEVKNEDLEMIIEFLRNIRNTFPTAKVFVTSRPVVRRQLEQACQAISFDILPFDCFTQEHFLTSVWRQKYPAQDSTGFEEYAKMCLERLEALGAKENEIAGVPLQCKMIAEVFADEASYYAETKQLFVEEAGCSFRTTLLEIYRLYLQRQLEPSRCSYKCMEQGESTCDASCRVRSFHVWQAIQLLFPASARKVVKRVNTFEDLSALSRFGPALLIPDSNPGNKQTLEFSHRTFAEYLVAEYLAENIRTGLRQSKRPIHQPILREFVLLWESVVAYFLNAFIGQERTLETSLALELGRAASFLSNAGMWWNPFMQCVRHDFGYLLKSLTTAKMSANRWPRSTQWGFWKPEVGKLETILEVAVAKCSVPTVHTLVQFFEHQYTSSVLKRIFERSYNGRYRCRSVIHTVCQRADYELASIFADIMVTCRNTGILIECLQDTCIQSLEQVEKRIEVAQLLLSKRGSLISEPCVDKPGPLFTPWLHPKGFQFLIDNGAEVRKTLKGRSFLKHAVHYLKQEEICQVCRSIFVGRPITDLLFVLEQPVLRFRFPFRRARVLIRALHLISTKALTRSEEQFELVWQAGVETSENESPREELLELIRRPEVLEEYLQSYPNLFVVAVVEGDGEVVDVLLHHDSTLREKRFENVMRPVLMAVEEQQMSTFESGVQRATTNVCARDRPLCQVHV